MTQLLAKDFYDNPKDITKKLPRVTTILEKTRPKKEIIELARKQKKYDQELGKNAWNLMMSESRLRGINIHKYGEDTLSGLTVNLDPESEIYPYLLNLKPCLEQIKEVLSLEQVVYSFKHGYAGRTDICAPFDAFGTGEPKLTVLDIKSFGGYSRIDKKTGREYRTDTWSWWKKVPKKKRQPSTGLLTLFNYQDNHTWEDLHYKPRDAFCQLAAYSVGLKEMGFPIEQFSIIVVSPYQAQIMTLPNPAYPNLTQKLVENEWLKRLESFKQLYPN